jgi:hypothetical protein
MKKLYAALIIVALSSCGPTAREKEMMEQATADSLKAMEDMKRNAEDLATQQALAKDSLIPDSTAVADSIK